MNTHAKTIDPSEAARSDAPAPTATAANSATPAAAIAAASATSRRWRREWGPALEAVGFWALILAYMWGIEFRVSVAWNILCQVALGTIPIVSFALHREWPRTLGLRLDNLGRSAREVGVMTLAASAAILACGIGGGVALRVDAGLIPIWLVYVVWGLLQQLALQGFVQRRLSGAFRERRATALVSAALFASLHLPNPVLAPATLVAGYAWCRLYARTPNLVTLACSHATLAVLALAAFPPAWTHHLRVGPGYWLHV